MPARALITGGAGVLGRHQARLLLDRGYDVIIADCDGAALSAPDLAGAAAERRMDPAIGMAHVLDRAQAGDFLIMTHRDRAESVIAREHVLAAAFAAAPQSARNGSNS